MRSGAQHSSARGHFFHGRGLKPYSQSLATMLTSRTVMQALFVLALMFLAFVGGALAVASATAPGTYVQKAYRAASAYYEKRVARRDPLASDLWGSARSTARGVITAEKTRMERGLTLYTSGDSARAQMIGPGGAVAYEWARPFSQVWDRTAMVRSPVPDSQVCFRGAHLFPSGDLLVIYEGVGDSPYGYGMAKLDRHSNVLWKNLDHFHHDFFVADDGLIYGLTHRYRPQPVPGMGHLSLPVLEDFLVVVSAADGSTVRRVSLLDAFANSDYRDMLWLVPNASLADPLHVNSVKRLNAEQAALLAPKVPAAAPGQILLSLRELGHGTVALLDPQQGKIVWAIRGPWQAQHDADLLPNGNLLLFDNTGHYGPGGHSRILEVNPATSGIEWMYAGNAQHVFDSPIRGSQERQPNGNTLIVESQAGRMFEVSAQGEIVWDFLMPIRGGSGDERIPIVSYAQRIDPATLDPEFQRILYTNLQAKEMESE
jgi:hypothetical protein